MFYHVFYGFFLRISKSITAIEDVVFNFINATTFIEIDDNAFPAELAIAKFSLKKGIFKDFHIRINPGELPLGSAYEAKRYAKDYIECRYHQQPTEKTISR